MEARDSSAELQRLTGEFMIAYSDLWKQTFDMHWSGVRIYKTPSDIVAMQEIVVETEPTLIVETGVQWGGSSLLFASLLDLVGSPGKVVGIDIDLERADSRVRSHPRIELLEGSSTDPAIIERVRELAEGERVMVDLDSDHAAAHVIEELRLLGPLVTEGCYLVVEDTFTTIPSTHPEYRPGPLDALEAWFEQDRPQFELDRWRERFLTTTNPRGYLRRVGGATSAADAWRPRACLVGGLEDPPPHPSLELDAESLGKATSGSGDERYESAKHGADVEHMWRALESQRARAVELEDRLEAIRRSRAHRFYRALRRVPGMRNFLSRPPR